MKTLIKQGGDLSVLDKSKVYNVKLDPLLTSVKHFKRGYVRGLLIIDTIYNAWFVIHNNPDYKGDECDPLLKSKHQKLYSWSLSYNSDKTHYNIEISSPEHTINNLL